MCRTCEILFPLHTYSFYKTVIINNFYRRTRQRPYAHSQSNIYNIYKEAEIVYKGLVSQAKRIKKFKKNLRIKLKNEQFQVIYK